MSSLVLAVHPRVTYSSATGAVRRTTPVLEAGVPAWRVNEFFTRLARSFAARGQTEGSVLLHRDQCLELGFPDAMPTDTLFLAALRAAGWQISPRCYPTVTAHSHPVLPDLHIGFLHWIAAEGRRYPLIDPADVPASLGRMAKWQDLTGVSCHGSPGMNAIGILRHAHQRFRGLKTEPKWKPAPAPVGYACEIAFNSYHWHAQGYGLTDVDELDVNKAYCAAYISCEVARWGLAHTGKTVFDPKRAGYWLVELAPWTETRIPHPAGYGRTDEKGRRWVTTPTLILLTKLTRAGVYGGFTIHDSWTSIGYQVLRPMGTQLSELMHTEGIDPQIVACAKTAQQIVYGQFTTRTGLIHRPDWFSAVIAYARTLLWIRAWRAAQDSGVWPLAFMTDAVHYPLGQAPTGEHFPLAATVGKFKLAAVTPKVPAQRRRRNAA